MKVFPWGGSEELWYKTAKLAVEKGHKVYSLTQYWSAPHPKIIELQQAGVNTMFYQSKAYSLINRIAIKVGIKTRTVEIVPELDADIYVISNGTLFDFVNHRGTIEGITEGNKPYIIINQHNYDNGNILPIAARASTVKIIDKAKLFYFVSERNLLSAERQISYKFTNAKLINNPINIKNSCVKAFPENDKLLMACVARFDCNYKGQDILLEVLSALPWQSRSFSLNLYGAGPHLDYLKALVEFYGLANKVSIIGHVNNIDEIWENNQVLVLPSLSEGTPLSLIEAMLSGRAVVSTDVGGNALYVINGETGYLAEVASVKCISEALEKLWSNRSLLPNMGINAFNRAVEITDLHPDDTLLQAIVSCA
ncbi:glycosyltransferase family 4 protein [Hymenobacter sp. UV11]|uniref:glycosyltransferase family 4 protein n=1 Tax=Hymenobacter sp. UV11 TaxID=1849735 RepID=UPI0014150B7F|nr:glycosyltransferase family 4 protein [Hymenobacter sp. UV11]